MNVVYFDPDGAAAEHPVFRAGFAAFCDPTDPEGRAPEERSVEITPNSLHALVAFGITERLRGAAPDGWADVPGVDSLIMPGALDSAVEIFYEADRDTYGPVREVRVAESNGVEYRLRLDRREYQRTLTRLTDLFNAARRAGYAVRLRL